MDAATGVVKMADQKHHQADTETEKTAVLHEIAQEVEHERAQHGHSVLDGEQVLSNEEGDSEGDPDATLADDIDAIPPAMPSGN